MSSSTKSVRARPYPALKSLWRTQVVAAAALVAMALILPLTYIGQQATETLQWSLEKRSDPGSWRPTVVRTNLSAADRKQGTQALDNVLSAVTDREKMGEPLPRRTIQSLDSPTGVPTVWYYLQEGPLEPLYGPGLWVVSVDMSMAVSGALLSSGIATAALTMWLVAYRLIWRRTAERVSEETAALRSRYVLGAHDVKGPLMAIQGYMEATEDGVMSVEEFAAAVPEEIKNIKSITEDLGRLAWLEEGKEPVRMQAVDLWPHVSGEAAASAWTVDEPLRNGSSLAWADAGLVVQALSIASSWMGRRGLRPETVALEGPHKAQTRVGELEQAVCLTIGFGAAIPLNARDDAALELLVRIQELQRGSTVVAPDSVALSWRPAAHF